MAVPGETKSVGEEQVKKKPGTETITNITNVSKPTMTVSRPPADKNTGVAIVVFPGGGYSNLAWEHEGTMVSTWLNSIGVTSVVAQILVPLASHFAPEGKRGEVVGQIMSGLLIGILLARAVAGVLSTFVGWRGVYVVSAVLMAGIIVVLARSIPYRAPDSHTSYGKLLGSLARIYRNEPVLRRRAIYQFAMFGSFSVFWTAITFFLSAAPFHFSTAAIGAVALAGAAGAFIAPVAGRLGDAGYGRIATGCALVLASAAFALTLFQTSIVAIIAGAILLDLAIQTTLILGQHAIYALNPAERSRLNTLYISTFFIGGALGSALAATLYERGGWPAVVALGAGMPLVAFLIWLTEPRRAIVSA